MARLPAGCPFSERCALVEARCRTDRPVLSIAANDESVLRACHKDAFQVLRQGWKAKP
jgi:oligopeptide transport system ATP-binding protein